MHPRMLPLSRHVRAFGLLVPSLLLFGCAGELENPERFSAPSMSGCTLDIDVPADIFGTPDEPKKCGLSSCHTNTGVIAANLDLVSPGVESRLVGVTAACTGLLIDPTDIDSSVLVRKLLPTPSCGARMPFGTPPLSDAEIECVREWALEAAAAGGADGGAMSMDDAGAADVDGGM